MRLSVRQKVPVILQQSPSECGGACLAMLLSALGRAATLDECVEATGGGRDGASARAMIEGAHSLGARARALAAPDVLLPGIELPVIAHWQFDHYVVVERVSSRTATIVDPARGRRVIPAEEFSEGFTGVVLVAEAGADWDEADRRPAPPSGTRTMLAVLRRTPGLGWLITQMAFAAVILQVLAIVPAAASLVILNQILPFGLDNLLAAAAVVAVALFVGRVLVALARSAFLLTLETRADRRVMDEAFHRMLKLPYGFFERRSQGDTVMRLMSTASVRQSLGVQGLGALLDGVLSLGYIAILFVVGTWVGITAVAFGVAQVGTVWITGRLLRPYVDEELHDQASTQSVLVEVVAGMATVKANANEASALRRLRVAHSRQLASSVRRARISVVAEAFTGTLQLAAPVVTLLWGTHLVLSGGLSVGSLIAASIVVGLFMSSAASSVSAAQQLMLVGGIIDRLADLFNQEPEQPEEPRPTLPELRGDVEVRDLWVRYGGFGPAALNGVSFRVEAGETLALVGSSGAGKSTVVKALVGLLPASGGVVSFDGHDISTVELGSLRSQLGVVLQDAVVFAGTIRENIVFGSDDIGGDTVEHAAAQACLLEEIRAMPMGFDTQISEGGAALSGGQRQRLMLARALVRRPRVLVLDEATSHLDARTEKAVTDVLDGLTCTRIVIAHRLSTVRTADRIAVIEAGQLVGLGTHDELLSSCEAYLSLVMPQGATRPAV